MVCSGSRSLGGMNWAEARSAIPLSPPVSQETKKHLMIYLSAQQQCCMAAITWHLNFDDKGKQLLEYLDPASNKFPSMVRKGYFLITLFYPPGFCGEPFIYLSLPPLGSGFWNSESCLTRTLAALTISFPGASPSLLSPLSTMATNLISNLRPSASVLLPICHVGQGSLIAEWFQALPRKAEWAAS